MKQSSIYDQMTRPEKEVAEFLKKLGIKWCYEKPVFVCDKNKDKNRIYLDVIRLISF